MKRVLVIAPHPDDEVLGCGGTIAKHTTAGDEVYLCIVTKAYPPEWPEAEIARRRKEVLKVNKTLGIKKTYFLDLPSVKLDTIPQKELNAALSKVIETTRPEVLYLPHKGDLNKDHQIVFGTAMVAARPKADTTVRKIVCFETLSETEWAAPSGADSFSPNLFVDISETLETKLKAMAEYSSELKQFPHPRSLEAITALARLRGSTVGVTAAEAFMLVRELQP